MGYNEWSYKSSSPLLGLPAAGRLIAMSFPTADHPVDQGSTGGHQDRRNTYVYVCVRLTVSVKSAVLRKEPGRLRYPKLLRVVRTFVRSPVRALRAYYWTDGTRTQFAWDLPSAEREG